MAHQNNGLCGCAKGRIEQVTAFALQKTHNNHSGKNVVYVFEVRRSDGSEYKINRTHSDLVRLDNSHVKEMVVEKDLKKSEFPKLPDRVSRTKGLTKMTKYFESLLRHQDNDAFSQAMKNFCQPDNHGIGCNLNRQDVIIFSPVSNIVSKKSVSTTGLTFKSGLEVSAPLVLPTYKVRTAYKSEDKRQISLQKNDIIRVYKKCPTGWWFVIHHNNSGWFPASHLNAVDEADIDRPVTLDTPEKFKAICDYTADNPDELSFISNAILEIKQKNMDGWWIAEYQDETGYVPASYLRPCSEMDAADACGCLDMCWETMDMKPAAKRPCTKCTSNGPENGINLATDEDITRDEKHAGESVKRNNTRTAGDNKTKL